MRKLSLAAVLISVMAWPVCAGDAPLREARTLRTVPLRSSSALHRADSPRLEKSLSAWTVNPCTPRVKSGTPDGLSRTDVRTPCSTDVTLTSGVRYSDDTSLYTNNLATYLSHKIWHPFGMEADANWALAAAGGGELGGCCISATLRDYARIGLFAMRAGVLPDGARVLPENWMRDSTTSSSGYEGYGYLWWLGPDGTYSARGIFGQMVWIDPDSRTVIVTHSAWPTAVGRELSRHRNALIDAIAEHIDSSPAH